MSCFVAGGEGWERLGTESKSARAWRSLSMDVSFDEAVDVTEAANIATRTYVGVSDRRRLRKSACLLRSIRPTHETPTANRSAGVSCMQLLGPSRAGAGQDRSCPASPPCSRTTSRVAADVQLARATAFGLCYCRIPRNARTNSKAQHPFHGSHAHVPNVLLSNMLGRRSAIPQSCFMIEL